MQARYGIEQRLIAPAPDISEADVISQTAAAELLEVRQQTVGNQLNDGRYTCVWRLRGVGGGFSARCLLRSEVEAVRDEAGRPGGAVSREAPELWAGDPPDLDGCGFGIERRVVVPAVGIDEWDVISQKAAREILGISRSNMTRALNRGRFTVVWDLQRDGMGSGSARLLLREEVLEAASGRRWMPKKNYFCASAVSSV